MRQEFSLLKDRASADRACAFLQGLPKDKAFRVIVEPQSSRRSEQQNRFLWMTYQRIIDLGGEELAGWTKEDLHEFFLGTVYGWEELDGLGRKRLKPLRRSSKLSKTEFVDFVAAIQQFMAERGIYLPDPNEELAA